MNIQGLYLEKEEIKSSITLKQEFDDHIKTNTGTDMAYLASAALWGFTNGAIFYQAIAKDSSLSLRISSITLPPIQWLIFPFKPHDGFFSNEMEKNKKISRIACYSLSFIAGLFFSYLLNSQTLFPFILACVAVTLSVSNIFAGYQLRNRSTYSEKIGRKDLFSHFSNWIAQVKDKTLEKIASFKTLSLEEAQAIQIENLQVQIKQMTLQINEDKANFDWLTKVVTSHSELNQTFQEYLKTSYGAIPKFMPGKGVKDPLINEWSKKRREVSHYEDLKLAFIEFLKANPQFTEQLLTVLKTPEERNLQLVLEWFPQNSELL